MSTARSGPPSHRLSDRDSANPILVNSRQKSNRVLKHLRNVAWEYTAITPDFQVGATTCVLYLTLSYKRKYPKYLDERIAGLGTAYTLRILLLLINRNDSEEEIQELTKVCMINNITIMAAWSREEAAQYLMTYKGYENKSPNMIKERIDSDYASIFHSALTSIKGVNKTNVVTLGIIFGDFAGISRATSEELSLCPGFGKVKARRVREAFHQPFFPGRQAAEETEKGKEKDPAEGPGLPPQTQEASGSHDGRVTTEFGQQEQEPGVREYSPDWDMKLDFNPSDDESAASNKKAQPLNSSPGRPPGKKRRHAIRVDADLKLPDCRYMATGTIHSLDIQSLQGIIPLTRLNNVTAHHAYNLQG
ncbi:ssDNA endonuclease and repair protein rad10 [Tulasnella sp. 403]|nr:ssDNA endonuclease and repair protein rad10 [Tulasnella sp. 403]